MFFNRRKKYNGKVAALLPAFGFSLEEAGVMKTANVLDIAWDQKYNEYEGALYVAFLFLAGLIKEEENGKNTLKKQLELMKKIQYVMDDWKPKGVVRGKLALQFTLKAEEWINRSQQKSAPDFVFSPNMPDVTQSEPISAYGAGQYLLALVQDVPSVGEVTSGSKLPLHFIFAMSVIDLTTSNPTMFVTLEKGITDSIFLCVIDASGNHTNLGDGSDYTDKHTFENASIDIICESLNIDRSLVSKTSG